MRQFVGSVRDASTVRDLLLGVALGARSSAPRPSWTKAELAMMEGDDEKSPDARTRRRWPTGVRPAATTPRCSGTSCTMAALGMPFEPAAHGVTVTTLSGGEQKRLVLEALLRGPDEVLMLDEPDNFLDVPGKRWLEERLRESTKTVLYVSHDRELLASTATRIVTVELGAAGNTAWTHPRWLRDVPRGPARPASSGSRSCAGAGTRSTRSSRRWC